ncbi:uncharacterized protein F4807DRAFT_436560 [Annulohypoxylon truncatum]|uniref:uncharacterized protein n=1 Tax=Annulohypoxylon truncatum TaxID=327061 RepID=UPI00200742FD|nr:uncharacterized protein F4807DRAFT_436560 [Annulohypoxylon truncatum]KAI1206974.1 hypothetical protein F4807DRAFT_436560 [Annulohypoxylon truncatum]
MSNASAGNTQSRQNETTGIKESFFGPPLSQAQLAQLDQAQIKPFLKAPRSQDVSFIARKIPFEERANPTIHEGHPDFDSALKYFSFLLKSTQLTLQEILERTFSPHEIRLLEAAVAPSPLASLQRDNIIRYQRILETRFKGQTPSLELTLTLLFFGFPVAPMKPGIPDVDVAKDIDFGEHKLALSSDPLEFLDDYSQRSYGDPSERVNDPYFPQLCDTQEFPSMSLRGGALPTNMEWETDDAPRAPQQPGRPMRVYGYQGSVLADPNQPLYSRLVEATDQVLSAAEGVDYAIRLEVWDLSDVASAHVVGEATGMIRHTSAEPSSSDDIYALLQQWFGDNNLDGEYSCFVCFDKEETPESCQPFYEIERYLVRVWDASNERMVYMKVPENLQSTHKPNQFHGEYLRAMRALFPKVPHGYLQFADGGPITYGLFDPPPETWTQIINDQARGGELPLLSFSLFPIPRDQVAVWVPGSFAYDNDFSPQKGTRPRQSGTVHQDTLKLTGTNEDRLNIERILGEVEASNPWMKSINFAGLDLWIPGEDYWETIIQPGRVSFGPGGVTAQALLEWRDILSGFLRSRIHGTNTTSNIVARPVYSSYSFHAKDSRDRLFSMPAIDSEGSFAEFKEAVKSTLYPDYSDTQKELVLHLTQTTWGRNNIDFVVGSDTDEDGWNWIVRRITEPNITVSLEVWTSGWSVEQKTTWGPRYDCGTPNYVVSSQIEVPSRRRPFSKTMDRIFKDTVNNESGAERAKRLRERFFWDAPSVFTNPAKPVVPTQGAPLETVVRTGPYVPGYTTAMRTPGEMARLERETHTLRGNLLDRIRECPYADCHRYFPFRDREGLSRHLTEDHATLKCFLCDRESTLLPYYDQNSIRRHFIDVHQREIGEATGHPVSTGKSHVPLSGPPQPAQPTQPTQPAPAFPKQAAPTPKGPKFTQAESKGTQFDGSEPKQSARSASRGRKSHRDEVILDWEEPPVTQTDFKIYPPIPRWREADEDDEIPPRRVPSPEWDLILEKETEGPFSFQPDPEWRCSRCFMPAGHGLEMAELHMAEEGSCKIRRGLGTTDVSKLPNRSGWIVPSENYDFGKAFFDFIEKYPGYRHSMFPVRDEMIQVTYDPAYNQVFSAGSMRDDPNHPANTIWTGVLALPWPPYEGTVIPLDDPQGDGPDSLFDEPSYVPGPSYNRTPLPVKDITFDDQNADPMNVEEPAEPEAPEDAPADPNYPPVDPPAGNQGAGLLPPDPFYTGPKKGDPGDSSDLSDDSQGNPPNAGGTEESSDDPWSIPRADAWVPPVKQPVRTPRARGKTPAQTNVPVKVEQAPALPPGNRRRRDDLSEPDTESGAVPALPSGSRRRRDDLSEPDTEGVSGTEYVPTAADDDDEIEPDLGGSRKRKRPNKDADPTFTQVGAGDEDLVPEEFSEASAVPDPVRNLAADAPRTPKKPRRGRGRPKSNTRKQSRPRGSSGKAAVQQQQQQVQVEEETPDMPAPPVAGPTAENRPFVELPPDWEAARRIVTESGRGTRPPRRFGFRRRSSSGEPEAAPAAEESPRRSSRTRRGTGPV